MTFQPRFQLLPHIQRQIKAIENTTGFVEAVRLRDDWIQKLRARTRVEDALASVQIEGSSITLEQAFALSEDLPARELSDSEREFTNYLRAFEAIDGLRGDRKAVLGRGDLLNVHRILVDGVRGGHRFAGQFRKEDVKVGDVVSGETVVHHQPPHWAQVEPEIEDLFGWIERTKKKGKGESDAWLHPVIQAGITQQRLAWIHPFVDGNGRSARMFTTLLLYQRGYDFKYLFDLSSYYNENRDRYYAALRTADASGDYTDWLIYFLGGFSSQMVRIKKRARSGAVSGGAD